MELIAIFQVCASITVDREVKRNKNLNFTIVHIRLELDLITYIYAVKCMHI
jgi:hypothetical protein